MDNIYLQGSETVHSAALIMRAAAEEMKRAAQEIASAIERFERLIPQAIADLELLVVRPEPIVRQANREEVGQPILRPEAQREMEAGSAGLEEPPEGP